MGRPRLDLALDEHGGAAMRMIDGMAVGEIAEAVDEGRQLVARLAAQAPAQHAETVMRPWGEPQRLDRITNRAGVAVRGLVTYLQSHRSGKVQRADGIAEHHRAVDVPGEKLVQAGVH